VKALSQRTSPVRRTGEGDHDVAEGALPPHGDAPHGPNALSVAFATPPPHAAATGEVLDSTAWRP
jgi:hypothetical protein